MTHVAIYKRVSTDDKGQDPQNQLRQLREFAANQHGWTVTHYDNDRATGKNSDRDQFRSMMKAASQRRFDAPRCGRDTTRQNHCAFLNRILWQRTNPALDLMVKTRLGS